MRGIVGDLLIIVSVLSALGIKGTAQGTSSSIDAQAVNEVADDNELDAVGFSGISTVRGAPC